MSLRKFHPWFGEATIRSVKSSAEFINIICRSFSVLFPILSFNISEFTGQYVICMHFSLVDIVFVFYVNASHTKGKQSSVKYWSNKFSFLQAILGLLLCLNYMSRVGGENYMNTAAGSGTAGYLDGAASSAQFNNMHGLYITPSNVLYAVDTGNVRVRKLFNSAVTSVAGTGNTASSGDGGLAVLATFNVPFGVWADSMNVFYVTEFGGQVIRKITSNIISTFAGTKTVSGVPSNPNGDGGAASSGLLNSPSHLFGNSNGVLYFADQAGNRVRLITATGTIYTLTGECGCIRRFYCWIALLSRDLQCTCCF